MKLIILLSITLKTVLKPQLNYPIQTIKQIFNGLAQTNKNHILTHCQQFHVMSETTLGYYPNRDDLTLLLNL